MCILCIHKVCKCICIHVYMESYLTSCQPIVCGVLVFHSRMYCASRVGLSFEMTAYGGFSRSYTLTLFVHFLQVIKVLLQISREHSWAEVVHCKLICMLTNMFYQIPDSSVDAASSGPLFISERVDLLGGIEFICLEVSNLDYGVIFSSD